MFQRMYFIIILLILTFLVGIIAPVPECYVTKVVCPLKKSLACAILDSKSVSPFSVSSPCCVNVEGSLVAENSACTLAALKFRMKPYAPPFESAEAPILPFSLLPVFFFKPVPRNTVVFIFEGGKRHDMPDPIPILLRKQSFLI